MLMLCKVDTHAAASHLSRINQPQTDPSSRHSHRAPSKTLKITKVPPKRRLRCHCTACCGEAPVERQRQTPLLDAVAAVGSQTDQVPLHVPGHKRGCGVDARFRELIGSAALQHDLTELPGLDFLSYPSTVILEAQHLAAEAFGADQTWFLVNGTTVGIHAAVMAACNPGDTLIAARNCHLTAVSAMVLTGCRPLWAQPRIVAGWDIAQDVTPAALESSFNAAAEQGLPARAALVVSPTYFGTASDIEGLAAVCHRHDALLIVDEAHGAHCRFDERFPQQWQLADAISVAESMESCWAYVPFAHGVQAALKEAGDKNHADIVIQSTHKMLGSLTQSAMLHVRGHRACRVRDRISRALQILQSSSPSYLLLTSLDAARAAAAAPGAFDEALSAAALARERIAALPRVRVMAAGCDGAVDCLPAVDPLKLTVAVDGLGITGYQAADWLLKHHGIATELATCNLVLAAFGIGTTQHHAQQLAEAMQALCEAHTGQDEQGVTTPIASRTQKLPQPVAQTTPRAAYFADSERVQWQDAVGRVSAELLCPYPPGIPAVVPGEILTSQSLASLQEVLAAGGVVTGAGDAQLQSVKVLRGRI